MNNRHHYGALLALLLLFVTPALVACGQATATIPHTATTATTVAPTPAATATPQPTATDQPTATPSPIPLPPTESSTATPTPQRLNLAVSPEWEEALAVLERSGDSLVPGYEWSLTFADDPAAELTAGSAEAAIVIDGRGPIVREEPLAFSVPFTTNWELINAAEAEAILSNGHRLVRVIPWSAMTPANKALRVDGLHPTDPDYPFRRAWSLAAAPDHAAAAEALAPLLAEALAPLPTIRLAAVGDVNFDRAPADILLTTGDPSYAFSRVKPIFDAADYNVANLETALGDVGEPADKRYTFRSPPEAAGAIAAGGIDLVSLANNHALDYGPEALLQGIDLLSAAGVATIGGGADDAAAHAPHIAEIGGLRVAFLGYVHVPVEAVTNFDTQTWTATADAPGLAWADPARVRADVAAIRPEVDLVVVILHSGYEYIEEPGEEQIAAARAAVDAGADLVIGHHAHILQGIHRYNDGVIAYGLGNFHFDIDGPPETAILNVWLDQNGVRQLELIPAIIQEHGQPWPAEWWQAEPILARVYYLTTILNANP